MVEWFECWRQLCFASFYTCFEVDLMTEITWNIQTFQYVKIVIDVATVFVMCLSCVVNVCSIGRYTITRGWVETMSDVVLRCINCSSRYVSFYIWKPYCHVTLTPHNVIVAVLFSERSQRILYALRCILNKDKNNISFIYTYASNTI